MESISVAFKGRMESSFNKTTLFLAATCSLFLKRAHQIVEHRFLDSFDNGINMSVLLYAFAKVLPNCPTEFLMGSNSMETVEQLFLQAGNKYIRIYDSAPADPLAGGRLTTRALKDVLWSFATMSWSPRLKLNKVVGVAMELFGQVELAFSGRDDHMEEEVFAEQFTTGQLTIILWSFKAVQKWNDGKRFLLGRKIGRVIVGVLVKRENVLGRKDISIVLEALSALHLRPARGVAEVLLGRLARLVEEEEEEEGHGDGDLQLLNLSNTLNAVVQLGLDEEKMAQKLFRLVAAKVD